MLCSATVFAVAVFQAQSGCGGEQASSNDGQRVTGNAASAVAEPQVPPGVEGEHADPAGEALEEAGETGASPEPESDPEPASETHGGANRKAEMKGEPNAEAIPAFLGASKSGIVLERPRSNGDDVEAGIGGLNAAPQQAPQQSPQQSPQQAGSAH